MLGMSLPAPSRYGAIAAPVSVFLRQDIVMLGANGMRGGLAKYPPLLFAPEGSLVWAENNTECNGRHAYLIMAHKDDMAFRALLRLLDDACNDIFVHKDAKNTARDKDDTFAGVIRAGCFAVPRANVTWGLSWA